MFALSYHHVAATAACVLYACVVDVVTTWQISREGVRIMFIQLPESAAHQCCNSLTAAARTHTQTDRLTDRHLLVPNGRLVSTHELLSVLTTYHLAIAAHNVRQSAAATRSVSDCRLFCLCLLLQCCAKMLLAAEHAREKATSSSARLLQLLREVDALALLRTA